MIISFEQNADFYADIAETARETGDYRKALRYLGDAVARDSSVYNLMSVAMLYQDMGRYEFAVEECFSILDSTRLDYEELSDLYLLLSESLGKLGYFMQSWYYLSKRADYEKEFEDEEDIKSIFEDICTKIEEEIKSPKLNFSDEIREKQYQKCFRDATALYLSNDYKSALEHAKIIPNTAEYYPDALMLMSKCYVYQDQTDKAIECWKESLKMNSNEGSAINGLAVFSEEDALVRQLISQFDSKREEDIRYAINAACLKGMYEKALQLGNILLSKDYYNPHNHFIMGAIYYNMGKKDTSHTFFKDVLSMYSNKYPAEYMLSSFKRHKKLSLLFEFVPQEIANRIIYILRKEIKAHGFKSSFMSSNAFRQAVMFALSKNINPDLSIELLNHIEKEYNNAILVAIRQLLIKPNVHFEIRRKIIMILLDTLKRGRVRMVNEGIISNLSLKTPPSYEDYPKELRVSYCNAFAFLATVGIPFEKSLSKLVEKIYLTNEEIQSYKAMSAAITYLCVSDQNIFVIDNLASVFDADVTLINEYIKSIKTLL